MARRRDATAGGRPLAGADGELFLTGDGTHGLFDDRDAYDDPVMARAAWERARRPTWRHSWRDDRWPPGGALAYDGITDTVRRADMGDPAAVAAAVAADVASVEAFRERDPGAAAAVAAELEEYVTALQLLAGLSATRRPSTPLAKADLMMKVMDRGTWRADGAA